MYIQFSSDRVDMALILRYPQITKSTGPVVAVAVCILVYHTVPCSSLYISRSIDFTFIILQNEKPKKKN